MTSRRGARRRVETITALAIVSVLATGCGSKLSERELRSAASSSAGATRSASTDTADGAETGEVDASDALTAGSDTATGLTTSGGGSGANGAAGAASGGGAGAASGGVAGGTAAVAGRKPEIRLASISTLSGPVSHALNDYPVAIKAWEADVNARGGVDGHPVKILLIDDQGDPGRAYAFARQANEQDKVLAYFGVTGLGTTGVVRYAEEQRIPIIGVTGVPAEDSPMVFAPQLGSVKGLPRSYVTDVVVVAKTKKVALMGLREAGAILEKAKAEFRTYSARLGIQTVYEADASVAQPDYTAEVLSARQAGAEAIVFVSDYASAIRLARSAHRQGWRPPIIGPWNFYRPDFPGGDDADGIVTQASMVPFTISAKFKPYLDAVRRYQPGGALGNIGADAWAAGKLLEVIGPKLGVQPTRAEVFKGLYGLRGETLGGLVPPITFPQGSHVNVNLCSIPIVWSAKQKRWNAPVADTFFCAVDEGRLERVTSKW